MGLDMGGGQTIIQAIPRGKITDMGPAVVVLDKAGKRFAGSDLTRLLTAELNAHKYNGATVRWSEADAERILSHGYGTVDASLAPELKAWPVRIGARKEVVDISGPVVSVCTQMVDPVVKGIHRLAGIVEEKYAGPNFGQNEMEQMLSNIIVTAQNSNVRGYLDMVANVMKEGKMDCSFTELPDKRWAVAEASMK